jgi:hypothetical protein
VLETVRKELEKDLALCSQLQLGLAHRTVRWCTGQCPVRQAGPLSGLDDGIQLKFTGPSGGAPDCPVSHPRRTRRPREKQRGDVAIIHQTVRRCTGLSGEPTVACANGRPRNLRVTRGCANGRQGAPDCPVCTGQCPVCQLPPEDQWSDAPEKEGNHAPDSYND